jgi:two-component system response regulator PilR (NtrC family)
LALTPQNETAIPPDQSSRPDDDSTADEIDSSADLDAGDKESESSPLGTLPEDAESLESYLEDIEKHVIVEALEATRWNKTAAAKKLGITFRALRYKLKKLNLD